MGVSSDRLISTKTNRFASRLQCGDVFFHNIFAKYSLKTFDYSREFS